MPASGTEREKSTVTPTEPSPNAENPNAENPNAENPNAENPSGDGGLPDSAECASGDTRPCYPHDKKGCTYDPAKDEYRCEGVCQTGKESCLEDGRWSGQCEAPTTPSEEVCDGLDNDCDGKIDNQPDSDELLSQPCYDTKFIGCTGDPINGYKCDGACRAGLSVCDPKNRAYGSCRGMILPKDRDSCDTAGADENCNGKANEGCTCINGETRSFYTGPQGTAGQGRCKAGTQTCKNSQWDTTDREILPSPELCNGEDDDCNGEIDNISPRPCYTGPQGTAGQGACKVGTQACTNGQWASGCAGQVLPATESCNNQDDDCNGLIDDALTRPCYNSNANTSCTETNGSINCLGSCKGGIQTCASGQWGSCVGEILPTTETCNNQDDDCDGKIDEGVTRPCLDNLGCPVAADGKPVCRGVCQTGTQTCQSGRWLTCNGQIPPQTEICDGLDNDCDGQIDNKTNSSEKLSQVCYPAGEKGCSLDPVSGRYTCVGACQTGAQFCNSQNGQYDGACTGAITPTHEYMACFDGHDNSCNGNTDFDERGVNFTAQAQDLCRATYHFFDGALTWRGIVSDNKDALYLLGDYTGMITLPINNTNNTFTAPHGRRDILIKIRPDGTILWVSSFCGNTTGANCHPRAIAYHSGSLFITGYLQGSNTFGTHTVNNASAPPASFVTRIDFDATSGTPLYKWAKILQTSAGNQAYAITADDQDVFIGGYASGNNFPLLPNQTPISTNGHNPFILKYEREHGTHLSSALFRTEGNNRQDRIWSLKLVNNNSREIVAAGSFTNWIYVSADANTKVFSAGGRDGFVARLGGGLASGLPASGSGLGINNGVQWFTRAGADDADTITALALDSQDNVYLTGDMEGASGILTGVLPTTGRNFTLYRHYPLPAPNPSSTLMLYGRQAMFIAKLSSAGAPLWIRGAGANNFPVLSVITPNLALGLDIHIRPTYQPNSPNDQGLFVLGAFVGNFDIYQNNPTNPALHNQNRQTRLVMAHLNPTTGSLVQLQPPATQQLTADNPTQHNLSANQDWFAPNFAFDPYGVDIVPVNAVLSSTTTREEISPLTWKVMDASIRYLTKGIAPYLVPTPAAPLPNP